MKKKKISKKKLNYRNLFQNFILNQIIKQTGRLKIL